MIAVASALLLALASVPSLTGPVVDAAGVLSQPERSRLEELAKGARATSGGNGPQLAFLLIPSLEGEPIESYAIRVGERWKLGSKQAGNGLLFVVAVEDREVRIEVGQGIEGEITDLQANRIIRELIVPAFREGAYGAGLRVAAEQSLTLLGVDLGQPDHSGSNDVQVPPWIPLLLFVGLYLLARKFGIPIGGMGGGGGYRGGGGGGGGYRGGGGGFSGGGSSGKW